MIDLCQLDIREKINQLSSDLGHRDLLKYIYSEIRVPLITDHGQMISFPRTQVITSSAKYQLRYAQSCLSAKLYY